MKKVCIFQESIPDYCVSFFNGLSSTLEREGIGFTAVAVEPPADLGYMDSLEEVACGVRIRNLRFGKRAYWQCGVRRFTSEVDLVILP